MNQECGYSQREEAEDASFGPNRSTGQPGFAVQNRGGKVPFKQVAAVGNGVKKGFAKVKAGMPSDGQPEICRSPQGEREDQACDRHVRCTDDSFPGVSQVSGPKYKGQTDRRRPESYSARQSELGVSAKQEFFRQSDKHERQRPQRCPTQEAGSMKREHSEGISAKLRYQPDQQAHFAEPQKNPQPE